MGSSPDSESRTDHIVFYDGYCVLCSKSIDFILSRDILAAFQFASLQSDFAQRVLPERALIRRLDLMTTITSDLNPFSVGEVTVVDLDPETGVSYRQVAIN